MKKIKPIVAALLAGVAGMTAAPAQELKGFTMDNIVLYQTNEVLEKRVSGVEALGAYITRLQTIAGDFFANARRPETFHIVVAIRPGKHARVWFVSSTRAGDAKEFTPLRTKLEAVTPPDAREGPVVFAISAKLAGGDGKNRRDDKDYQPPTPQEWLDAAKGLQPPAPLSDEFLNVVWPESR